MNCSFLRNLAGASAQRGFTVYELMITVAVLAVLLTVGVPSMLNAAEKRRTIAAAERVWSELQLARSASVAGSEQVFANIVGGNNWAFGISDNAACDPTDNSPACVLRDVATLNPITHIVAQADYPRVLLTTTAAQVTFSPQRATASIANINITSTDSVGYVMRVEVGMLGQISICSPAADPSTYIAGYRPC
jgi:type IV fimbrial biogenesis protein FimT